MDGLSGITSNIIYDSPSSPMSLWANIIMLVLIVAIAGFLIYRRRKLQHHVEA